MLYMPTADGRVIALNPSSGEVCRRFGEGTGQINLWRGMPNVRLGGYYSTSPVVATQRVLVVGGDPTADLNALWDIKDVYKSGQRVERPV